MIEKPDGAVEVLDGQGWIWLKHAHGTEQDIVSAARACIGKEDRGMDEKDINLLKHILREGHLTPFEFVNFTFVVKCPLYVRAQWFRHRTQTYVEQSRRWTSSGFDFYVPDECPHVTELIEECHSLAENTYLKLIASKVRPEIARGVLPQNMMTVFQCRVSLRNLLHFLELRDDKHAQPEIREYAVAIVKMLDEHFPHTMAEWRLQRGE